jgi:hypothetical protein
VQETTGLLVGGTADNQKIEEIKELELSLSIFRM